MDIDKMQKINKLARELMQHGVASDMNEAARQAELMINRDDDSISDVMDIKSRNESPKQQPAQLGGSGDRIFDLQYDLKNLTNYIKEQANTLKALREELEQVKAEMSKLKAIKEQRPVLIKNPENEQTHLQKQDVQKEEPHPKVGSYNPGEVSIEKFFYSGPPK